MYTEFRPASGDIATTPEVWADTFRHSTRYSAATEISMRLDSRWKLIKHFVPRGSRLMDAGCGFGEWVVFLSRRGYLAQGLDYSPELIARLRKEYPQLKWVEGRTQSLPYAGACLDAIVSWGVIEHDPDGPQQALTEFHRVLTSTGRLIVTVPVDTARMRADSKAQFPSGGKFFQFLFELKELKAALTKANFRVLKSGYCSKNAQSLLFPKSRYVSAPFRAIIKTMPAIPGYYAMIYAVCEPCN
jgi:ubiquinone/menaquinone biosynthesis C-methylase UbiE